MEIHNESIVSYETAKLLKQAGFNDTCRAFWKVWNGKTNLYNCDKGQCFDYCCNNMFEMYNDSAEENVTAPTLQMAMKWLRETHNLFVDIYYDYDFREGYKFSIHKLTKGTTLETHNENYSTYEEACEEGIKYCLEKFI